ncbi:carboxypeptidase-like regulatory domain-containing protein [Maioricimonas sp. JC845]|uniref:carboxypeptidase-like regulatory domain-containing protein n=1 Tax=Maioricimonas sp. JC845 TaxID=3232138 RepID=UPI0034582B75
MSTQRPDDRATPSAPSGQRFLGGAVYTESARTVTVPRLFATVSALVLLLLLLFVIVRSFRDQLGTRLLVTAGAIDYQSELLTPLRFVDQDVAVIRSAPGVALKVDDEDPELPNTATEADFARLINEVLPATTQDTLILFVRTHAVAARGGMYLLPTDVDPLRPHGGVELGELLRAVADCPARNRFVLFDAASTDRNMRIGMLGNDFAWHLRREFEALTADETDIGNLFVLCSAGDGQRSWSSSAVQQSVFSAFAGYCLQGGVAADGDGENGRRDSLLTAGEIASFVERSVADWSLKHRGVLQRPFRLQAGDDFQVAGVSEFLTLESHFSEHIPLASAGQKENEELQQQAQDEGATPDPESPPKAFPTTDVLLGRILLGWQFAEQLRSTTQPFLRPRHWALYLQSLQQAERLLLAGRLEAAEASLDTLTGPLEEDLKTPPSELLTHPWSLAYLDLLGDDPASHPSFVALQNALNGPTPASLNRLTTSPLVEASLARRLAASGMATGQGDDTLWTDPDLLQLVITTRTQAETTARLRSQTTPLSEETPPSSAPYILRLCQSAIDRADRLRVAGEQELLIGRPEAARFQFELASRTYDDAASTCRLTEQQLNQIHLTVLDLCGLSQWLGHSGSDRAAWIETAGRLRALVDAISAFRTEPRAELVPALVGLCDELQRLATSSARQALSKSDPAALEGLLELTSLSPDMRLQILTALVRQEDAPGKAASLRKYATDPTDAIALPIPLKALSEALNADSAELAELFGPWDSRREPVMLSDLRDNESLRASRSELGDRFRQELTRLNADPMQLPPGQTGYEQYVTHLVRSPFQAQLLVLTRFEPMATRELLNRLTADQLAWQLQRLEKETAATEIDSGRVRAAILKNLRTLDPSYQDALSRRQQPFFLTGTTTREVAPSGQIDVQLQVNTVLELAAADRPRLVIDWFAVRDHQTVLEVENLLTGKRSRPMAATEPETDSTADQTGDAVSWRTQIPIDELMRDTPVPVRIRLLTQPGNVTAGTGELTAWIELSDGSRYWVPIEFSQSGSEETPLEVVVTDASGAPAGPAIRVLPNQGLPLTVALRSRLVSPEPVQIDFVSGSETQTVEVTAVPGGIPQPVTPTADFEMPIVAGELKIRARRGTEIVDAETIQVDVLNPRTSFESTVTFDPQKGQLQASVRQTAPSRSADPIAVMLDILGTGVTGGTLTGSIPDLETPATLDAIVEADELGTPFEAAVGAAGVPRLFTYRVDRVTGNVESIRRTAVRITSPPDQQAYHYATNAESPLSVGIHVDSASECEVHIGIDRNRNEYLENDERLGGGRFWSGRRVVTRWSASTDPPGFRLASKVSDIAFDLDPAGLVGPQRILVQLLAGDRSLTAGRWVYFLKQPPQLTFVTPATGQKVAWGDPLQVTVGCDSPAWRSIEQIEVGIDRNNNGQWDDDETLSSAQPVVDGQLTFRTTNRVTDVFDSRALLEAPDDPMPAAPPSPDNGAEAAAAPAEPPGLPTQVVLMTRGRLPIHTVGGDAEPVEPTSTPVTRHVVTLISQSEKPPVTGSIVGEVVTLDGLTQRDAIVALGMERTQTDDDGRFEFRNVPVGEHTIQAGKGKRLGQETVEVVAGETARVRIFIIRR